MTEQQLADTRAARDAGVALLTALRALQSYGNDGAGWSRAISLAITETERAGHWLHDAENVAAMSLQGAGQ